MPRTDFIATLARSCSQRLATRPPVRSSGCQSARGSARLAATAFALAALSSVTATAPALGQEAAQASSEPLDALRACRAIEEEGERLACYDREVAAVLGASEKGEVQVVRKEEVEKTRRGLFGFRLPKIGLFGGDDSEMNLLRSTITKVRPIRRGWIITIEEGSVWQLNSVPSRLRPPKVGDPVEFKKAALGSYFVRIDGQMGVKGRRIE